MFKKILIILALFICLVSPVAAAADYYLPYPGILADHPLYWLKMFRDRAQLLFITNKTVKARQFLSYADKRLGGGWALIEGNKKNLGVTTLTKAEKYLDQAVVKGKDTELKEVLKKAVKKHAEVVALLKASAGDEFSGQFESMLVQLNEHQAELGLIAETSVEIKINDGENQVVSATVSAQNALEALTKVKSDIKVKNYDFGSLVEAIEGKTNSNQKAWIYFVNGTAGTVAADKQNLKPGDVVEWRYEKPLY